MDQTRRIYLGQSVEVAKCTLQKMFKIINRDTKEKHWLDKEGVVAKIAEQQ